MTLFLRSFALGLSLALAAGCSTDNVANEVAAKNDSNIKRAVNLYSAYQFTHGWQGPKDEKALRDFVAESGLPEKNFQMMGIDPKNLDNVFMSDRDGKPFKIRYAVQGGMAASDALVFEDEGRSGKRLVAFNGPVIEDVDQARYEELWKHGGTPRGMAHTGTRPEAPSPEVSNKQSAKP